LLKLECFVVFEESFVSLESGDVDLLALLYVLDLLPGRIDVLTKELSKELFWV